MICLSFDAKAEFEVSGQLQAFGGGLLSPQPEGVTSHTGGLESQIKTQYEFTRALRFNSDLWAKYDGLNKSDEEITQGELDEFSIEWRKGGRRLKLGYSIRVWEGTDLVNPMDFIHSRNYRDPLNSRLRSAPGLFYDDTWGDLSWDFTYLIRQQNVKLPGENSPWYPRRLYLPLEFEDFKVLLPQDLNYEVYSDVEIENALENNFAFRLQYHGASFGISLAAFEGSASPPLLVPVVDFDVSSGVNELQARSPIGIEPHYYRQRVFGTTLVWTLGSWIFRASGNHMQPLSDDTRVPTWSQLGVLGVEKTLYLGDQLFILIFQAVGSRRPETGGLSMLASLYEESYMAGVRWTISEKWTWLQAFFQEQKMFSHFYHTEIDFNFAPAWNLSLQADFFQGPPPSVLGTYGGNDQIILKTSYSF